MFNAFPPGIGSIAHPDQEQALRRRRRPRLDAVLGTEHVADPGFGPLARPDQHQRAGDGAHHVVQEAVGLDLESDQRIRSAT